MVYIQYFRQYIYGGIGIVFYMFAMDFAVPILSIFHFYCSNFPFPNPNPDRAKKNKNLTNLNWQDICKTFVR